MEKHEQVFHPLFGYSMCYGPYEAAEPAVAGNVPNGTIVLCRVCQRLGVIPDEGHELEFLPPGTERGVDGRTFHLSQPGS
jgi:hypothetical protein